MRAKRGFSLIEILVVIIIIGITATFIMVAIGDFGASREVTATSERFSEYLKLLQQRAILSGENLGLKISKEGYEGYHLVNNQWQVLANNGVFHFYSFPKKVKIIFKTNLSKAPDIVIYNSGELSAFQIDFGTDNEPHLLTLIGNKDGQLTLSHAKK